MGKRHRSTGRNRDHVSDPLDDLDESPARPLRPASPVALRPPVRIPSSVEDRRRWAPGRLDIQPREPARDAVGRPARIVHKTAAPRVVRGPGGKPMKARASLTTRALSRAPAAFADARKTIICLKRKVRRQVLFAKNLTRSGKGSPKRRNEYSDVECT